MRRISARGLVLHTVTTYLANQVTEDQQSATPDSQCLTAMCDQPKRSLRLLRIFVSSLTHRSKDLSLTFCLSGRYQVENVLNGAIGFVIGVFDLAEWLQCCAGPVMK